MKNVHHGRRVLVVDKLAKRANDVSILLGAMGCEVAVVGDLLFASRLWPMVDVAIVDDDAFGDNGMTLVSSCRRAHPGVFCVVAAGWSRFSDVRGLAGYVLVKPFQGPALVDALRVSTSLPRTATPFAAAMR